MTPFPFETDSDFALFDNNNPIASDQNSHLFWGRLEKYTLLPNEDPSVFFAHIAKAQAMNHYVVGQFNYELGYVFEPKLTPLLSPANQTLGEITLYQHHQTLDQKAVSDFLQSIVSPDHGDITITTTPLDKKRYLENIKKIKEYIKQGDIYQINFTDTHPFTYHGCPIALFNTLRKRQSVTYGALLHQQEKILSLSPELFFKKLGNQLTLKPMKGTIAAGHTIAEQEANSKYLYEDHKNRAENLMIVDLMRNDLSKIAKKGSVKVPSLFTIEPYQTLLQMTSTITGEVATDISLLQLLSCLFPCGSITGAPKIRAMEIIHRLEQRPRKLYTGAIGFILPNNDMRFSVPIRTLTIDAEGTGLFGVGSGIVDDSHPEMEYEECLLKAQFLNHTSA